MRETTALEKLTISIINIFFVLLMFIPFYFLMNNLLEKKLILILIFFSYNLIFFIFNENKCLGMIIMKADYKEEYPKLNQFVYIILYTASFSTLLFWFFFPFDLFLFTMIFVQLPTVIIKRTTLHVYLSGNITTVVKK